MALFPVSANCQQNTSAAAAAVGRYPAESRLLQTSPALPPSSNTQQRAHPQVQAGLYSMMTGYMAANRAFLCALSWLSTALHRCRWLRSLMMRNGLFHVKFRALPPKVLGATLLHLPVAWRRLQYLAESGRESAFPLMEAVQKSEAAFAEKFTEYSKWRCWTEGEGHKQVRPAGQARPGRRRRRQEH